MNMPVDFRLLQAAVQAGQQGITPEQQALYDSLLSQSQSAAQPSGQIDGLKSYTMPEVQARIPTAEEIAAAAALPDEPVQSPRMTTQVSPAQTGFSTPVYQGAEPMQQGGLSMPQIQELSRSIASKQQVEDMRRQSQAAMLPPFFGALAGPGGTKRSIQPPTNVASGTQPPAGATPTSTISGMPTQGQASPATAPPATAPTATPTTTSGYRSFGEFYSTQFDKPLGRESATDDYSFKNKQVSKPRTAQQGAYTATIEALGQGQGLQYDADAGYMRDENDQPVAFDGNNWTVYTDAYPDGLVVKPGSKMYQKLMQQQTYRPAALAPDASTASYGLPQGQPIKLRTNYFQDGSPGPEGEFFVEVSANGDIYMQDPATGQRVVMNGNTLSLGNFPFKVAKSKTQNRPAYGIKPAEEWSQDKQAFYQPELEQVLPNVRATLDAIRQNGGYGFNEKGEIQQLSMDESWARMADMFDPLYQSQLANDSNLQRKVYGRAADERQEQLAERVYEFWKNLEDESKGGLTPGQTPTPQQMIQSATSNKVRNSVSNSLAIGGGNVYTTDAAKTQQAMNALAKEIAGDPVKNLGVLSDPNTVGKDALSARDVKSWFPYYANWYNANFRDIPASALEAPYGQKDANGKWYGNPYRIKQDLDTAIKQGDQAQVVSILDLIAQTLPSGAKSFRGLDRRSTPTVGPEPAYQLQRTSSTTSTVNAAVPGSGRQTQKTTYKVRDYAGREHDSVDKAIEVASGAMERGLFDTNVGNYVNIAAAGLSGDFTPEDKARVSGALNAMDDLSRRAASNPQLLQESVISNIQKYQQAVLNDLRLVSRQTDNKGNSMLTDAMVDDFIKSLKQVYGSEAVVQSVVASGPKDKSGKPIQLNPADYKKTLKDYITNTNYGINFIKKGDANYQTLVKESPAVTHLTNVITSYATGKDNVVPSMFENLGVHRMGRIQFLDNVARDMGVANSSTLQTIRDFSPLMLSGYTSKSINDQIKSKLQDPQRQYRKQQ